MARCRWASRVGTLLTKATPSGYTSQFGPIVVGESAESFGSHPRVYLPHAYLGEKRQAADGLAIAITNAVVHCASAVAVFLRGMRESASDG